MHLLNDERSFVPLGVTGTKGGPLVLSKTHIVRVRLPLSESDALDRISESAPSDSPTSTLLLVGGSVLEGTLTVVTPPSLSRRQVLCKKIGGGRVPAFEVLIVNSAVSNLIREGKTFQIPSIMQTGKGKGMIQLNDALFDLVTKGIIEPREAYLKAIDKTYLLGMFQAEQIPTNFLE